MYLGNLPAQTTQPCGCVDAAQQVTDEKNRVALSDLALAISLLSILFHWVRK